MTPNKLQPGDEIRIVALARSASDIDETVLRRATMALESLGLTVTFSENVFSRSQRGCPSDQEKVDDLHTAFTDSKVKAILAAVGGFNSNQLLDKIDWKLIDANPKIFAGFSDITVLNHAILAKTGLITYAAPNFYCFGMLPQNSYSLEYFKRCLFADQPDEYEIAPSANFYDYPWNYDEKSSRATLPNNGPVIIQKGRAEGTLLGGNMCSLNLLNGTEYFPRIAGDIILCIEDDSYDSILETFERNFQSVAQQPYFRQVKAILIGRFQQESQPTEQALRDIILSKNIEQTMSVIANLDFGHTDPKFTYPVGGRVAVETNDIATIRFFSS